MTQLCFVRGKCLLSCMNPNRGPVNQSLQSQSASGIEAFFALKSSNRMLNSRTNILGTRTSGKLAIHK